MDQENSKSLKNWNLFSGSSKINVYLNLYVCINNEETRDDPRVVRMKFKRNKMSVGKRHWERQVISIKFPYCHKANVCAYKSRV